MQHKLTTTIWLAASMMLAAACGGGGGVSASTVCSDSCALEKECDPTSTCDADEAQCEAAVAALRDDFIDQLDDCFTSATCPMDSDDCFESVAASIQPRDIDTAFATACTSRHDACEDSFSDDFCSQSVILDDDIVVQAQACLDEDCSAIEDCLDSLVVGS